MCSFFLNLNVAEGFNLRVKITKVKKAQQKEIEQL